MNSVKKITKVLLIILLSLFQISFVNSLSFPFNSLNCVLAAIIFITLINYDSGLQFMIISSLVLELYSANTFGLIFISYFFTFISIVWIFSNLLTNKSFYSFILIAIFSIFIYNIMFYVFNNLLFSLI